MNLPLLIFLFGIFVIILISYSSKKIDFVAVSLMGCFVAGFITGLIYGLDLSFFISNIEFEAIIVILSMSIITKIAQDSNILEYVAVKLFKVSKGNRTIFFYLRRRCF